METPVSGMDGADEIAERGRLEAVLAANGIDPARAAAPLGHPLAMLADAIPQLAWRSRDLGRWTWSSRQWTAFTGQDGAGSGGLDWLDCVHPDDRARTMDAWARAPERGLLEVGHRIRRAPGPGYRWFETRATPRDAPDGSREWFGTCTDVHDLKVAIERQEGLLHELQHRVLNLLAHLRALLRRSLERGRTKEDFASHFEDRLRSVARVQAVIAHDPFRRPGLAEILSNELQAVQAREGEDAHLSGPPVDLSPRAAEALGAAFHELAINALKFGAVGRTGCSLRVSWRVERTAGDAPCLVLAWSETAPGRPRPDAGGFGMEVLRDRLPYELGGRSRVRIAPAGLTFLFEVPRGEDVRLAAAPEPGGPA